MISRRHFLKTTAIGIGSLGLFSGRGNGEQTAPTGTWQQYQYDPQNSGINPNTAGPKAGLENTITTRLDNRPRPIAPIADQSQCYVQGDGATYAIDRSTGSIAWKANQIRVAWGGLAYADGMVLGAGSTLVALDADSGEVVWYYGLSQDRVAGHVPTISEGVAYLGDYNGTFHAVDINNGSAVWTESIGSPITTSPVVSDGVVYFTDGKGEMHARDAANGDSIWTEHIAKYGLEGSPTLAGGTLYVGGGSNNEVYAVDAESGDRNWAASTSSSVESSPLVHDGTVIALDTGGTIYAITANSGEQTWTTTTVSSGARDPVVADNIVYVSGPGGVEAVRIADGERQFRTENLNYPSAPIVVGETIYLTDQADSVTEFQAFNESTPTSTSTTTQSTQTDSQDTSGAITTTAGTQTETSGPGFGIATAVAGVIATGMTIGRTIMSSEDTDEA